MDCALLQVTDLMFFLLLLAVFLVAYGIAQQALLYPNSTKSWSILLGVFYDPYFSIYGDFNLQELEGYKLMRQKLMHII